jgi:alkyl sulfatase BDS1-like metallo-beta-lactamase superfamily hydrolase
VVPGVYQVRGYDLSNMTLIERRAPAGSSSTR